MWENHLICLARHFCSNKLLLMLFMRIRHLGLPLNVDHGYIIVRLIHMCEVKMNVLSLWQVSFEISFRNKWHTAWNRNDLTFCPLWRQIIFLGSVWFSLLCAETKPKTYYCTVLIDKSYNIYELERCPIEKINNGKRDAWMILMCATSKKCAHLKSD